MTSRYKIILMIEPKVSAMCKLKLNNFEPFELSHVM